MSYWIVRKDGCYEFGPYDNIRQAELEIKYHCGCGGSPNDWSIVWKPEESENTLSGDDEQSHNNSCSGGGAIYAEEKDVFGDWLPWIFVIITIAGAYSAKYVGEKACIWLILAGWAFWGYLMYLHDKMQKK